MDESNVGFTNNIPLCMLQHKLVSPEELIKLIWKKSTEVVPRSKQIEWMEVPNKLR